MAHSNIYKLNPKQTYFKVTTSWQMKKQTKIDFRCQLVLSNDSLIASKIKVFVYIIYVARPDFAELDVFLGQHILLTLEQHLNPKI